MYLNLYNDRITQLHAQQEACGGSSYVMSFDLEYRLTL